MDLAQIYQMAQDALPYVLGIMVALTGLAHAAQAAANAFDRFAQRTETTRDDAAAKRLVRIADRCADFMDSLAAWIPRFGPKGRGDDRS